MRVFNNHSQHVVTALLVVGMFGLNALPAHAQKQTSGQRPIAPLKHPVGDIPDTQAFITYQSPLGFSMEVPEGWARSTTPNGVRFVSKLDGLEISVWPRTQAPSLSSVEKNELARLKQQGRAIRISQVSKVVLPVGEAIKIIYSDNSKPNSITGKQVREERWRFLYYRKGLQVAVDFYAPYGADNIDQWHRMSRSFKWSRP